MGVPVWAIQKEEMNLVSDFTVQFVPYSPESNIAELHYVVLCIKESSVIKLH